MAFVAFSSLPLPLSLMAAPRKTASTWPIKAAPACICRASHGEEGRRGGRRAHLRSFPLFPINYLCAERSPLIIDPSREPICLSQFSRWKKKKNVFLLVSFVAGSPCEHDGICVNTPGSFACNCTQGFTGPRCETNVNECESHPCQNDGSCLDDPGTFRCVCMPGK